MRTFALAVITVALLVGLWFTSYTPATAYVRDGWYQLHDSLTGTYRVTVLSTDDDTACLAIVQGQGVTALDNAACSQWRAQPFTPAQTPIREMPSKGKLPIAPVR